MNNSSGDQILNLLTYLLIAMIVILFVLVIVYLILKLKKDKETVSLNVSKDKKSNTNKTATANMQYGKQSIFNFMEFNEIKDNMIMQRKGERYLMVVECQGVNYDLMSGVEKSGVEDGFVQFLNTLRHPIQIYIQTRSVNLKGSIDTYKERIKDIEEKLNSMKKRYKEMQDSENYTEEQLNKMFFEITKQTNLYEYGKDVVYNTEKMSSNKNVSTKKFYVIVPYYTSELGSNEFDKSEVESLAFSELYTRCQSIIRTLGVCEVSGKILNSVELAELLYVAYNRDEAEVFEIGRALEAGCDEMYSTAPDVLEKKMKNLDKEIEEKAIKKAREVVNEVQDERRLKIKQKEVSMDDLINDLALSIIEENKEYLGDEVVDEAKEKIKKETKAKGGKPNEQKKTRTRKS